jgi:predicted transcriptional regulator
MPNIIASTLGKTLEELGITRNALAVEAKVRPVTINDIVAGNAKAIKFETLISILDTLNWFSKEKGLNKRYNVTDVFLYEQKEGDL